MPDLENALTHRTISAAGETMHSTLTAEQAAYSRDSLASGIYQRLFQWVCILLFVICVVYSLT